MARQRKFKAAQLTNCNAKNGTSLKRAASQYIPRYWASKSALVLLIFAVAIYYLRLQKSVSNIVTPFPQPKAVIQDGLDVPDKLWGTYRPGLYFGTKTRLPDSLVTGFMWFTHELVNQRLAIRHWCDQANKLPKYGWIRHDGINYGEQEIIEDDFSINTTFVKRPGGNHGGDWSVKISIKPRDVQLKRTPVSLIYYVSSDEADTYKMTPTVINGDYLSNVQGVSKSLGRFSVRFPERPTTDAQSKSPVIHSSYLTMRGPGLHSMNEIAEQMIIYNQKKKNMERPGVPVPIAFPGAVQLPAYPGEPNVFIHEVTVIPPYEFEVLFESESFVHRGYSLAGKELENNVERHRKDFDERFEKTFELAAKGFNESGITFAKAALSNMLGGIGYFYGKSIVQSADNPQPVEYWPASLYTAVPSRSFFPRGFLWDEGFHNLIISKWDRSISRDIISHWLDLMNIDGWIPREVILGPEAQARVPIEFIVQRNNNANPPTFFLTVQSMLREIKKTEPEEDVKFLKLIFPRMKAIFNWMNTSQVGNRPGTYYWRGRNQSAIHELNAKTLASGLDDYPRASHPNELEAHLDLRCWIALAASVLVDIAKIIGEPYENHQNTFNYLTNNELLDQLHWSEEHQRYLDYGLHTEHVKLVRPESPPTQHGERPQKLPKVRMVSKQPKLQFVNSFGYVGLFPFLLQMIEPNSPKLGKVISDIRKEDLLWTEYGLRSLSKDSSIYMKRNTEKDPPYWRGPIWININYLAVRALHHYSNVAGPYQVEAGKIYKELRSNIINNMVNEYRRTGYIWEQYNDKTGHGQGVHPFTGWSSLVVLMMSEKY